MPSAWYATPLAHAVGRDAAGRRALAGAERRRTTMRWADLPATRAAVVRPRVFWDGGNGGTFFATAGVTAENRDGGTIRGVVLPADRRAVRRSAGNRRLDGGVVGADRSSAARYVVSGACGRRRSSATITSSARSASAIGTTRRSAKCTIRVARGAAHLGGRRGASSATRIAPRDVPQFAYTFTDSRRVRAGRHGVVTVAVASARAPGSIIHNEYGTFFSPRLSALLAAWRVDQPHCRSGPGSSAHRR